MSKPKVVSLFSGCGGMDLGFKHAGYELIWANDFEKAACDTYSMNLGKHIVHGDITELDLKKIPDCDVMIGGFPCQDFSMIWKRGGLETDRGNLYKYFVKAVKLKKPRIFVAENVKGLLTANKGAAVKTITEIHTDGDVENSEGNWCYMNDRDIIKLREMRNMLWYEKLCDKYSDWDDYKYIQKDILTKNYEDEYIPKILERKIYKVGEPKSSDSPDIYGVEWLLEEDAIMKKKHKKNTFKTTFINLSS